MRPRKRDFRGDARKRAKNYDTVSSDDSEAYRRKDPFAGRNRKRPSGRRAQLKRVRRQEKLQRRKIIFRRLPKPVI